MSNTALRFDFEPEEIGILTAALIVTIKEHSQEITKLGLKSIYNKIGLELGLSEDIL